VWPTSNALMLSSKVLCLRGLRFAPAAFSILPMLIRWVRYRCKSASCNFTQECERCWWQRGPSRPGNDDWKPCLFLLEESRLSCCGHGLQYVRHIVKHLSQDLRDHRKQQQASARVMCCTMSVMCYAAGSSC